MKIYTKTGDCGTTGLFAGPRVDKDHPRIEAYGAVDELGAVLGMAVTTLTASKLPEGNTSATSEQPLDPSMDSLIGLLTSLQSDLFSIGAELATPDPVLHGMCLLNEQRITQLEQWIDRIDCQLPPLQHFILPGGNAAAATLHLGRTVCRRAERQVVRLSHQPGVHDCRLIVIYLNRLSDLLFVLARYANWSSGVAETAWQKPN
jgi:cob(I)alamin adenosyltransferase